MYEESGTGSARCVHSCLMVYGTVQCNDVTVESTFLSGLGEITCPTLARYCSDMYSSRVLRA